MTAESFRLIPLTQGLFAKVDAHLFEELNKHKWCACKHGRRFVAVRNVPRPEGGGTILMHRVIAGALPGEEPDHADGDSLNNLLSNLSLGDRLANTHSFLRKRAGASSKYRGVSWDGFRHKWAAYITHCGRRYYLGRFIEETAAAAAFDTKARELGWPEHGLNFPSTRP